MPTVKKNNIWVINNEFFYTTEGSNVFGDYLQIIITPKVLIFFSRRMPNIFNKLVFHVRLVRYTILKTIDPLRRICN